MKSIEEQLRDEAEGWRPSIPDNDYITGEIKAINSRTSDYGTYPVVTVEDGDGDWVAIHAFHTVLRNQLAEKRPKVGEVIHVLYKGETRSKNGRDFQNYSVEVEREGAEQPEFSWDSYADAPMGEEYVEAAAEPPPAETKKKKPAQTKMGEDADEIPY